jgi:hypothetical protein
MLRPTTLYQGCWVRRPPATKTAYRIHFIPPFTSRIMAYKHTSAAANRLAKQLEFFIAMNSIAITDSISLSEAGSTIIVRFYKNHKHKDEKHSVSHDTKTIVKLLKDFYHESLPLRYSQGSANSNADSRVALRKLLRILPINHPDLKPLISNIKRSEYRTPRFKYNQPKYKD